VWRPWGVPDYSRRGTLEPVDAAAYAEQGVWAILQYSVRKKSHATVLRSLVSGNPRVRAVGLSQQPGSCKVLRMLGWAEKAVWDHI
jgi:hypothetical protein